MQFSLQPNATTTVPRPPEPSTAGKPTEIVGRSLPLQSTGHQVMLAQVLRYLTQTGTADVKILNLGRELQLQSAQPLQPGQLVLLTPRGDGLQLSTDSRAAYAALTRLLLPLSGSLRESLASLQLPARQPSPTGSQFQVMAAASPHSRSANSPLSALVASLTGRLRAGLSGSAPAVMTGKQFPQPGAAQPGAAQPGTALTSSRVNLAPDAGQRSGPQLSPEAPVAQMRATRSTGNETSIDARAGSRQQQAAGLSARLQGILDQLPTRSELKDPANLRQAIAQLGTAAPATSPATLLSGGAQSSSGGLAQLLVPLLKQFLSSPAPGSIPAAAAAAAGPQLGRLTETLARVLLGQMKPIGVESEDADVRRYELVVKNDQQLDSFNLQFESTRISRHNREQSSAREESRAQERQWTVRLAFDFPETGKVTAFILLFGWQRLEMKFWSERKATFRRIEQKRRYLGERLEAHLKIQGVEQISIDVFEGEAPETHSPVSTRLIHEVA